MTHVALTIAGSDPSGGAGLQADLKTFQQHGVYGMSVVTLMTVQNTQTLGAVQAVDVDFAMAQLEAVLSDFRPGAAKTGALGNRRMIEAVAERAARFDFPLVVDPVMISKHGVALLDEAAIDALQKTLLPRALLVTPNRFEAARMTGQSTSTVSDMIRAAEAIARRGVRYVLIKGATGLKSEATDVLWCDGQIRLFDAPVIQTLHTHGSGCVFSAAITARIARGEDIVTAVTHAKAFITEAIRTAPGLGSGRGPVNFQVTPLRAN